MGLAVYGKTRCYVKRFRVAAAAASAGDEPSELGTPAAPRKGATSYGGSPNIMAAAQLAGEDALIDLLMGQGGPASKGVANVEFHCGFRKSHPPNSSSFHHGQCMELMVC